MTPKILGLVRSCGECPNYGYYSGGKSECDKTGEIVTDKTTVAPFCPLADFPSRALADMGATIRVLREPNTYGLVLAILSHIATKLKTPLGVSGMMTIVLRDGESLQLSHDYITAITVYPWAVHFVSGEKTYKLHPDALPPQLYEEVKAEGIDEPLWTKRDLM